MNPPGPGGFGHQGTSMTAIDLPCLKKREDSTPVGVRQGNPAILVWLRPSAARPLGAEEKAALG